MYSYKIAFSSLILIVILLNFLQINFIQGLIRIKWIDSIFDLINYEPIEKNQKFFQNFVWMPNHNVIQYSSYILLSNNTSIIIVRSIIAVDIDNIGWEKFQNSSFICILKSISKGFIIESPATLKITLIHQKGQKIYCSFNNESSIQSEDVSIAIIRFGDFNKKTENLTIENPWSYKLINYQVPRIVGVNGEKLKMLVYV